MADKANLRQVMEGKPFQIESKIVACGTFAATGLIETQSNNALGLEYESLRILSPGVQCSATQEQNQTQNERETDFKDDKYIPLQYRVPRSGTR